MRRTLGSFSYVEFCSVSQTTGADKNDKVTIQILNAIDVLSF